jgi:hypothetical protein|tara:strand:- start:9404 stop:10339 length:936 start_codon:yes stop_codon:yes gene_type:complete
MATVRIYYSRADQDYSNWNLFHFPGTMDQEDAVSLFPDDTVDNTYPYGPRSKSDFIANDSLAYVDVELNNAVKFAIYIRRKDFVTDYNGEFDAALKIEDDLLNEYQYEVGYVWEINTNVNPNTDFYIKEDSPYVYADSTYTNVLATDVTCTTNNNFDKELDTISFDDGGHDGGTGIDQGSYQYIKIFYSKGDAHFVEIPDSHVFPQADGNGIKDIRSYSVLYLLGNTYTIGENMDLSIDASALAVEKADALQVCEKAVANTLYKLGENIDAFDDAAFLADVDAYKATKDIALTATVDYLKQQLDIRTTLTA